MKKSFFSLASAAAVGIATTHFIAPAQAAKIAGFQTLGSQMTGMQVTAHFQNGGSQNLTWASSDTQSGGVNGNGWSLNQSGDTFNSPWILNASQSLSSLIINAIPGNTVFDDGSHPSTEGSERGWSFDVLLGNLPTSFPYSHPIEISAGDLFGKLTLTWDRGFTGELKFLADTDTIVQAVPEATSVVGLLAFGVFGASSLMKRNSIRI
ncbi:hypothetical protein B6N60_02983 [Richelia sinica FACHB-800]|uniref:PEP-CTERM protein-sorting domain-containing protein n=1 Tax=Richelia sinica FACHB-800 TaxID=1357546 RepID=A0A975T915_9NOST|nr:hypothetical protein [Richelia sinica]MBD2666726.1 hypothetical protein [Richelia sinica FACHB-800]QXE24279.1 hypothetical protein B6N60_02983 [Richelia sinica FACHB-800]